MPSETLGMTQRERAEHALRSGLDWLFITAAIVAVTGVVTGHATWYMAVAPVVAGVSVAVLDYCL